MNSPSSDYAVCDPPAATTIAPCDVVLSDGTTRDIAEMDFASLRRLQWDEERAFARQIADSPPGSSQRTLALSRGYDTITEILAASLRIEGRPLVMGYNARYAKWIEHLLARQLAAGMQEVNLFEIGFGPGLMLKQIADRGYPVAGIEVSPAMHRQAGELLGSERSGDLFLGDLLTHSLGDAKRRFSLVYWNDVFEHVPTDEIRHYLRHIYKLLAPGGSLVTITPNWHMRPSDVTGEFRPPRTEAIGFHLKEYTLREVTRLLRATGFSKVVTPLVVTRRRIVMCGDGLGSPKRVFEPCLEWLPFRCAHLACRGFGLGYTVATKQG